MRIGIDARLYGLEHRGIGRYVKELVDGLLDMDNQNEYVLFCSPSNVSQFRPEVDQPLAEICCSVTKVVVKSRWYSLGEQWEMLKVIKKAKVDLMHFPHFNVPFFYNKKFIVTVHDLIINRFPDSRATTHNQLLYQCKLWGYKKIIKHAIIKSHKIITPSEFVKQDIINHYHINPQKIQVIYEGVYQNKITLSINLSKWQIIKPYFLYVGAAYPHKNLDLMIQAFQQFNQSGQYQLVLVGREDYFYQKLKKQFPASANLIYTGEVSDSELSGLYQRGLSLILPSLYEGFGLPALEAQSFGLPVLAANNSCLPEILKDSALFFNPINQNDIINQLKYFVSHQESALQLKEKGLQNCQQFSWARFVKEVHSIYLAS